MNPAPDTTAGNGGTFGPREAAALLDQASRQARRQFSPAQPWLLAIRAVLVLAALGAVWLSVRGQHPYRGPGGPALLAVAAFVVVNFTATVAVRARATAGVSGRTRFSPAEIAVLAASWIVPFAVMAGLGVTRDSQSGYLLTVPLIAAGLAFAALMALRSGWRQCGTGLAVAATGAAGAAAGHAAAWAVTGAGLCLTLLGSAAVIAWQLHRPMKDTAITAGQLDPLIHVPTRLKIVATLAALPDGDTLSFTRLQDMIGLTPGNLIIHLRKLEEAGYIASSKASNGTVPVTTVALTGHGRTALGTYTQALRDLLGGL